MLVGIHVTASLVEGVGRSSTFRPGERVGTLTVYVAGLEGDNQSVPGHLRVLQIRIETSDCFSSALCEQIAQASNHS